MEEKILRGEFVRTIDGKIGKFVKYSSRPSTSIYKSQFNCFIRIQGRKTPIQCSRDYIKAHSTNIIDLVEVGDYVNGFKVEEVLPNGVGYRGIDDCIYDCGEIETIVTKEQFEKAKYTVKKENK